jgi:hypothetical protein
MESLRTAHASRAQEAEVAAAHAETRVANVSRGRVATFVVALVGFVTPLFRTADATLFQGIGAFGAIAFVVLVVLHARLFEEKARLQAKLAFHRRGLARLDGAWGTAATDGARYAAATEKHPYADDLDLFGKGSLFQRIDFTATRAGEARLAEMLLRAATPSVGDAQAEREAPTEQRDAVAELSENLDFREDFAVLGARMATEKADFEPLVKAIGAIDVLPSAPLLVFVAFAIPMCTLSLRIAASFGAVPKFSWIASAALGLLVLGALATRLQATAALGRLELPLARLQEILLRIDGMRFEAPRLQRLQARLRSGEGTVAPVIGALGRTQNLYAARNNDIFRLVIAPLVLWELTFALRFSTIALRLKGVGNAGENGTLTAALAAVAEFDALLSLAAFAAEEEGVFPTFVAEPVFLADGLAHPLLPANRRVANRFSLRRGAESSKASLAVDPAEMDAPVLLITGSNMAGKSTLLRTVGTAVVLAYAGTKVPARALTLGPLVVATSMRVRDSLGDGVSRFYAELAKLRTVVETGRHAPQGATLLFLLDEVLHGTNSRERNIGARALVSALLAEDGAAAIGLLSTHDLALTDLEVTTDGAVKNVHLRENVVADQMSFDYLLRRGPVTTSNALRLMKAAGLDLPGLDDSAGA